MSAVIRVPNGWEDVLTATHGEAWKKKFFPKLPQDINP